MTDDFKERKHCARKASEFLDKPRTEDDLRDLLITERQAAWASGFSAGQQQHRRSNTQ